MPADVGRRLRDALAGPQPTSDATERARDAVLGTVPVPRRAARWSWRPLLAVIGAVMLAAGVAVASNATRSSRTKPPPAAPVVATADPRPQAQLRAGRAVVTSPLGRISRPATAVVASPAGLFAAFGESGALVVTELDGDVRWRHPVNGTVVAIAWAPYPTYIAYIVNRGRGHDLRLMWANGTHDRLFASDVSATAPTWNRETTALTFTTREGRRVTRAR